MFGRADGCGMTAPFRDKGFIQCYEALTAFEVAEAREKFDRLEVLRTNQKFPAQEINLHLEHRWILDICKHERVLQAAKKILGPNIVLLSTCLITKYPTVSEKRENFKGNFVGWHQDLEYCGLVNVEPNNGPKLITMWLAIDKANEENGAMKFIPGSHKNGFFERVISSEEGNVLNDNRSMIIPENWREKTYQSTLSPGQCTFHDGMLVHGSGPTLTSRRMGLTVQFCPTNIKLDRPSNYEETIKHTGDFRKPILVAGEDTFGELEYFKFT